MRIKETIFAMNAATRAIFAAEGTGLLADGTDERATAETVQAYDSVQARLSPRKPFKYLGLFDCESRHPQRIGGGNLQRLHDLGLLGALPHAPPLLPTHQRPVLRSE